MVVLDSCESRNPRCPVLIPPFLKGVRGIRRPILPPLAEETIEIGI